MKRGVSMMCDERSEWQHVFSPHHHSQLNYPARLLRARSEGTSERLLVIVMCGIVRSEVKS